MRAGTNRSKILKTADCQFNRQSLPCVHGLNHDELVDKTGESVKERDRSSLCWTRNTGITLMGRCRMGDDHLGSVWHFHPPILTHSPSVAFRSVT